MRLPFGLEISKRGDSRYLRRRVAPIRAAKRSFAAAANNDMTFSWSSTPETINQALAAGLTSMRTRSRDLAMNTDHGAKFINLAKGNVVGPMGIVLQARSQNPDGTLDRLANDAIENEFKVWGGSEYASMCGKLGWVDLQDLFVSSVATDGEAIFRKVYGRGAGPWGYSLSQIDPVLLDVGYNKPLSGDHRICMGIEVDGWNRPIAYHFKSDGKQVDDYRAANGQHYRRISADQIIHEFLPERVGQLRGVPWMAPSMMRMKMFAAFEEAAVVNARIGAAKVGVITTADGTGPVGTETDPVTGDQLMDADPGSWIRLAEGEGIDSWNPAYPSGDFAPFSESILQSISSGLNVDYPSLASNPKGVSYSSMRSGLVETREVWKKLQEWTIRRFNAPVYREWLPVQLAVTGNIQIGGTPLLISKEEKHQRVRFQGRRWAWVDPLKDAQAAKLLVDEGFATRSEVIRDRGKDPLEVWTERADEDAVMDGLGIELVSEPATVVIGASNEDEETDET